MKKETSLLILCVLFMNACSNTPQATATPEATVTLPTMTDTPVPSPTMTETPVETPHIEDFIKITSSLPVEIAGTETTPRIAGAFEVDEALCFSCEIQMPEALAEEILGGYMARFMHRFGAEAHEGQPNEDEIAAALGKIAQAQRGEIPASEAVMTIPAYLLSQGLDGEYSEVKIVFRMGTEMQVPEGVIPIDTLSTLDVRGYGEVGEVRPVPVNAEIPGFVQTDKLGWGFGTVVDEKSGELVMIASPDYIFGGVDAWVKELQFAKMIVLRNEWIARFDGKRKPAMYGSNAYRKPADEIIKKGFEFVK